QPPPSISYGAPIGVAIYAILTRPLPSRPDGPLGARASRPHPPPYPPPQAGEGREGAAGRPRSQGLHQRGDTGVPIITSAIRARVAALVSCGSASREKKPCAMISWSGTGGAGWRKRSTTNSTT